MSSAIDVYGAQLAHRPPELLARVRGGGTVVLALSRWLGPIDDTDREILQRCRGPVLDIGCGPGRHVRALARRGVLALGVDVSPAAVGIARRRGAAVVEASVFDALPGAGSWRTALLLDGNIGIGGRPASLLARVSHLLAVGGRTIVETEPPHVAPATFELALATGRGGVSEWFPWARLGTDALVQIAADVGLSAGERVCIDGRWFQTLERCS